MHLQCASCVVPANPCGRATTTGAALLFAVFVLCGSPAIAVAQAPPATSAPAPAEAYYQFLLGRHLDGEGNETAALAALQRAATLDPASADVQAEIAAFQLRHNRRDEAEKAARAALALDAQNAEANRVLGLVYAASADGSAGSPTQAAAFIRDAIVHLERAVGPGGGDPTLQYTLGRLYLRSGATEKAVQSLSRVLGQNPGLVQVRLQLAQAQAAAKDLPGAIATLSEVLDEEPRVAAALAQYQEQAQRPRDAAETYTRALTVQPNNRDLKARRIAALHQAKEYTQAAAFAREAQKQHPDDGRFSRLLATMLFAAGDRTGAVDVLETSARTFKDSATQMALADIYSNVGRTADAERVLRQMVATEPANADALNYLGYMLAERGEKLDEAIRLVSRALESDPENGAYLDSLGWAHFRRGDLAQAEKYLLAAAQRLPANSEVQDHLGDLHARRGRWQDAIAAWTRALEGDGEDVDRTGIEKKIAGARSKTGAR